MVTHDTQVSVNAYFKHSRIKQYLKDGRALRIETVVNSPDDLGCHRRLPNLDELQTKARAANARLLDTERVGQGCVLASPAFERVALPSVTAEGRRPSPAVRRPSGHGPARRLCLTLNTVVGFTNRSLRAQVSQLLGAPYTANQMSYDLGRLRLNGLIERLDGTNTYAPTTEGQRVAIFYSKLHQRLLRPLLAANHHQHRHHRQSLATIDAHVQDYIKRSGLRNAA